MYSTCLFCTRDLGRNEAIESFPVGRRLAYDAERGRLWVVCRRCERWNLSPLEERWEAIEEAERLYHGTRLRASTDNVGLARLRDGTELVRVGAPARPEFAAWRYGDQFGRRRRRQLLIAGGGLAALGGLVAGGAAAGVGVAGFGWMLSQAAQRILRGNPAEVIARVPTADGVLAVKRRHLARTSIVPSHDAAFGLVLHLRRGDVALDGPDAARAAGQLLPAANRFGGARADVARAVTRIEQAGSPEALLASVARTAAAVTRVPPPARRSRWAAEPHKGGLIALPTVDRLALEMALHEEQERLAMQGELAPLEAAWRHAEEIAAIADDLLLPTGVDERLARLRDRRP